MSDWVTPQRLAAAYAFLRTLPPFDRWRLPNITEIEFIASKTKLHSGSYSKWLPDGPHIVEVSVSLHSHVDSVLQTTAHEMIHLGQAVRRTETSNTEHNAEFMRIAKLVCNRYGWDAKAFLGGHG